MQRSRPRRQNIDGASRLSAWGAAELDVLLHGLTSSYWDHRERGCEACNPEPCRTLLAYREHEVGCWRCQHGITVATERYGEPCWIRGHWLAHGDGCKRCNPCPRLREAIGYGLDFRQARMLLTRAEELRIDRAVQALELAGAVAEVSA